MNIQSRVRTNMKKTWGDEIPLPIHLLYPMPDGNGQTSESVTNGLAKPAWLEFHVAASTSTAGEGTTKD